MVRVALLVGIALALVVQVFANSGVAGIVFQCHISRDKLTMLPEIMRSSNSTFHDGLNIIDRYLAPDSKVAPTLQASLQKLKELDTAPRCNQLASSALIQTCTTLKGDNEAHESMEDTITEEKSLFAARFAVCELSDSADQSLVPADCASFILTESDTKEKKWFRFGSAKGRGTPISRYPEYDQATRQNRERCVAALQKSAVTGISYSNAKQTAHQWCSVLSVDIEKEKLLEYHRTVLETVLHQDEVFRSHAETLRQQAEASDFLSSQLRTFAQNTMDTYAALREVFTDAHTKVHNLVEDMGDQLQAQLEQSKSAHEAHDASIKARADRLYSEIMNFTSQQSTDLALARRNDAEEFSGRMSYFVELIEQRMIQLNSDIDSTSREAVVRASETLEIWELVKLGLAGADEIVSNMTSGMQKLQDRQEDLDAKLENSGKAAADLESKLLAMSDAASIFTGISDCFLAAASYCRYFIGVGAFLLLFCLGGWPMLAMVTTSILKLLWITFNTFKELAQLVFLAAGNILSSAMSAAQQCVDWKGALVLISSVAGIAFYFAAVETPTAYWQRWEKGDLSLFEPAHFVAMFVTLILLLCAISSRVLAFRESGLLQSGEYESYDEKECAV